VPEAATKTIAVSLQRRSLAEDADVYRTLGVNPAAVDWEQISVQLLLYLMRRTIDLIERKDQHWGQQ
jgi:hypothetical protein